MSVIHPAVLERVAAAVRRHCAHKGYVSGPNWNPLTPRDSVAALAMARLLVQSGQFDEYVAVAPEGHVYGFFFEQMGVPIRSLFVDYPPRQVTLCDDLSCLRGRRVLILEDDVVSGVSLRLVVDTLVQHPPQALSLYLGRDGDYQQLQNVPAEIATVYLAETSLDPAARPTHESALVAWAETLPLS